MVTQPTKCYANSKVRAPSEKTQLWTNASLSVLQKSRDQLSDPSIQQATHSNSWDQQQQRLSNPNPSCDQAHQDLHERRISKSTDQKLRTFSAKIN